MAEAPTTGSDKAVEASDHGDVAPLVCVKPWALQRPLTNADEHLQRHDYSTLDRG